MAGSRLAGWPHRQITVSVKEQFPDWGSNPRVVWDFAPIELAVEWVYHCLSKQFGLYYRNRHALLWGTGGSVGVVVPYLSGSPRGQTEYSAG